MKFVHFVVLLVVAVVACEGHNKDGGVVKNVQSANSVPDSNNLEDVLIKRLNSKCTQRDVSSCLILKLVTYMNRMLKKAAIQISDDLEITQNSSSVEYTNAQEDLARAGDSDEEQETQLLLNKMWTFVKTRSLRWRMFDDAELVVKNSPDADGSMNIAMSIQTPEGVEKGRGKMKNLGPFIAAAAVKIGILGGLAFKGLALLVGKALLVSKIALLLASIIGLKKLFSHQKHVTYEVVSHPHHGHETAGHDSYSSGWGREFGSSMDDIAQELAYSAHVPQNEVIEDFQSVEGQKAKESIVQSSQ